MTNREPMDTQSQGGGLGHHPAKLLGYRVDAFYLAFQGVIRPEVRADLEGQRLKASLLKTPAPFPSDLRREGFKGSLSPRSREGWWRVDGVWMVVTIDERASHEWTVEVQPSALLLMNHGPSEALALAREAAKTLLVEVLGERIRRLDLCADLEGFLDPDDPDGLDIQAFSLHQRTGYADIGKIVRYYRRGIRTGFMFGKGDALARIYDKTEHLALGLDDTKADDEYAAWRMMGWNGRSRVTRVEFQLRGRLLDELDLRNPAKLAERLDPVWTYCIRRWLRLVVLGTATRKERCHTDERWKVLDGVIFRQRAEPARRVRAPSEPQARRLVSAVVNYCAIAGTLGVLQHHDVANWSNARAEAWIQLTLADWAKATVRAAAKDLLERFDEPQEAVQHLIAKALAASAKYAPLSIVEALEVQHETHGRHRWRLRHRRAGVRPARFRR